MKILIFALGFFCHAFLLFAPIHEMGHFITALVLGYSADITKWSLTEVWPKPRGAHRFMIYWAGPLFESLFWWGFARKSKRLWIKTFSWGAWASSVLIAHTYTDVIRLGYAGVWVWYIGWPVVFLLAMWNNRKRRLSDERQQIRRSGRSGRIHGGKV